MVLMIDNTQEFPAKIQFHAIKTPCQQVEYVGSEEIIRWVPGKKKQKIKSGEYERFISDTKNLFEEIATYWVDAVENSIVNSDAFGGLIQTVRSYWSIWGPLVPGKSYLGDTTQYKFIPISDLFKLGHWRYFAGWLWGAESQNYATTGLVDMIKWGEFRYEERKRQLAENNKGQKGTALKYWQLTLDRLSPLETTMAPVYRRGTDEFCFYIKHPTKEQIDKIDFSHENKHAWLKENVLENVAYYISKSGLHFKATVSGYEMHFTGETTDLFLAFLMDAVISIEKRKIQYCHCGCKRPIPPGRKLYATDQCKENTPIRRITGWLRKRKSNGNLSSEKYEYYSDKANELLLEGYTVEAINAMFKKELREEGKTNGRKS